MKLHLETEHSVLSLVTGATLTGGDLPEGGRLPIELSLVGSLHPDVLDMFQPIGALVARQFMLERPQAELDKDLVAMKWELFRTNVTGALSNAQHRAERKDGTDTDILSELLCRLHTAVLQLQTLEADE